MILILLFISFAYSADDIQQINLGVPALIELKSQNRNAAKAKVRIDANAMIGGSQLYIHFKSCHPTYQQFYFYRPDEFTPMNSASDDVRDGYTISTEGYQDYIVIEQKAYNGQGANCKVVLTLLTVPFSYNNEYKVDETEIKNVTMAFKPISKVESTSADNVGKTILFMMDIPSQLQNSTVKRNYNELKNYWYLEWGNPNDPKACDNICNFLTESHYGHAINFDKVSRKRIYSDVDKPFISMYFDVVKPEDGERNFTVMYADAVTPPQFTKVIKIQGSSSVTILLCLLIFIILF